MGKKNVVISIMLLLIAVVGSAFIYYFTEVDEELVDNDQKVVGHIYNVGYLENVSETDRKIILDNYDDFKSYFETNTNYLYDGQGNIVSSWTDIILEKYNDEYFKNNSLAVLYIVCNSGSTTVEYKDSVIDGDKIKINYIKNIPEIGTMDMSGLFIIVEVPKEVKEIVN